MNDNELYTEKENAKAALNSALLEYFRAALNYGMSEIDMTNEVEDEIFVLGKKWKITNEEE